MKILLVHNQYRQKGGEDMVFADERALLESAGHEVRVYVRSNDELDEASALSIATNSLWSRRSHQALEQLFEQWRPAVMHVHNSFYVLSGSIYWAAAKYGVAVVQTLHNFRLMCLQATFFRDGKVCEDCLGKLPVPGMRRACHQGSVVQSVVLGLNLTLHRSIGTYRNKVHRYICLSEFSRQKFIEAGLDAERLVVKPNFAPKPSLARSSNPTGGLFIGRVSIDKGAGLLAEALALAGDDVANFLVAGAGPDEPVFAGTRAKLMGWKTQEQLSHLMAAASYVVIPSLTYEQFPRVLAEAFAFGVPVIAPVMGPLSTLVQDRGTGLHFKLGDSADLARVLIWADSHPEEMRAFGVKALAQYEAEFSPETNLERLLKIYAEAIGLNSQCI